MSPRSPVTLAFLLLLGTEPGLAGAAFAACGDPVVLTADFDDKAVDQPIGTGGAAVGEPVSVNSTLTAYVRDAPFATPALELQDASTVSAGAVRFEFLDGLEVSNGHLSIEATLQFNEINSFHMGLREQGTASRSFANLTFSIFGTISYSDANTGSYTLSTYAPGTPYRVRFDCDLNAGTNDVWLNDVLVLENEPHGITDRGIGSITFGLGFDPDLTGTMYVDDIHVEIWSPVSALSLDDVTPDQGGWVRMQFGPADLDVEGSFLPITAYEIYRRIDPLPPSAPSLGRHAGNGDVAPSSAERALLAGWDLVGIQPAHAEPEYNIVLPTQADATVEHGIHWSVFMVRAATADPCVYFAAGLDSAYSTDDIAPGVPQNLSIVHGSSGVSLAWDPAAEPDFQLFRIYRDTDPMFTPGPASLAHETASTGWLDSPADPAGVYYRLTAVDHAGNESDATDATAVTGVEGRGTPTAHVLRPGRPNPFRARTTIRFEIPVESNVALEVFDPRGQLVRTLARGPLSAGSHEVIWDGRTDAGHHVPPGVYFCRMVTPGFSATRKMIKVE